MIRIPRADANKNSGAWLTQLNSSRLASASNAENLLDFGHTHNSLTATLSIYRTCVGCCITI